MNETEGLPDDLPESADPFLYFKSADHVTSIPGGTALKSALTHRDADRVREYLQSSQENHRVEHLATVLRSIEKHYGKSARFQSNAVLAILEAIPSTEQLPQNLRRELCVMACNFDETLQRLPIDSLARLSPVANGKEESPSLWKRFADIYSSRSADRIEGEQRKFDDWCIDFIANAFLLDAPTAIAAIAPEHLNPTEILDIRIVEAMGSHYPGMFGTRKSAIEIIGAVAASGFDTEVAKLALRVITAGVDSMEPPDEEDGQMAERVAFILGELVRSIPKYAEPIAGFAPVLQALPGEPYVKANTWREKSTPLNDLHGQLQKRANKNQRAATLAVLLAFHGKFALQNLGNVRNTLQNIATQLLPDDARKLTEILGDWSWLRHLQEEAPDQTVDLFKNSDMARFLISNATGDGADIVLEAFPVYCHLSHLADVFSELPLTSENRCSQADIAEHAFQSPTAVSAELRWKIMESEKTPKVAVTQLANAQFEEISALEDGKRFHSWAQSSGRLEEFQNSSKLRLNDMGDTAWDKPHVGYLYLTLSAGPQLTNTYLGTLTDRATECALAEDVSASVATQTARLLIMALQGREIPKDVAKRFAKAAKPLVEDDRELTKALQDFAHAHSALAMFKKQRRGNEPGNKE